MAQYKLPMVEKLFKIIELLATGPERDMMEICGELDLPKATAYRLLLTMREHGYVELSPDTRKYRMGMSMFEFGTTFMDQEPIRVQAIPHLKKLTAKTKKASHIGIRAGDRVLYLETVSSPKSPRIAARAGKSFGMYPCAAGMVILAHLEEDEIERIIREQELVQPYAENSLRTKEDLKQVLAEVRMRGYAIDDQYLFNGVRCVGAPVVGFDNQVVAGICISGIKESVAQRRLPEIIEAVKVCAEQISVSCGYNAYAEAS